MWGIGPPFAKLSKQQVAVGPAGTFEQLVLTDSLSALVASPPLLYVTNAKKFCDWRLVLTAVTFQVTTAVQTSIRTCQTHYETICLAIFATLTLHLVLATSTAQNHVQHYSVVQTLASISFQ